MTAPMTPLVAPIRRCPIAMIVPATAPIRAARTVLEIKSSDDQNASQIMPTAKSAAPVVTWAASSQFGAFSTSIATYRVPSAPPCEGGRP